MTKNFLDADDDDDSLIVEKTFDKEPKNEQDYEDFAAPFSEIEKQNIETSDSPEPENAHAPTEESERTSDRSNDAPVFGNRSEPSSLTPSQRANGEDFWERKIEALKNENPLQPANSQTDDFQTFVEPANKPVNFSSFDTRNEETNFAAPSESNRETTKKDYPIFANSSYQSETSDETIRKSGLAYAAAIVLFGSIVFTLVLGWFADLLLGTSPWGKVGGIILGAIIGFIQFFRTTSQILKNKD